MEHESITVTGISRKTTRNDLIHVFSKYGEIVDLSINTAKSYALIKYAHESSIENVLKVEIKYQNHILRIRRTKVPKNTATDDRTIYRVPVEDHVFEACRRFLDVVSPFTVQVQEVLNVIEIPYAELQDRYGVVCQDLQRRLTKRFPHCVVHPFGSTVSGLGFQGSDVDVYVQVEQTTLPTARSDEVAYVKKSASLLRYYYNQQYTNVVAVTTARIPIVRCFHKPTQLQCDFNFKNMLGVCNSKLINHLQSIDPRIRPFLMLIKLWAKIHKISGKQGISNYGLTLLALFYLQQLPKPLIPPIYQLQTADTEYICEGWNGGFTYSRTHLPPIKNRSSLLELLAGFFTFYYQFDFGIYVMSVFTGKTYLKTDFDSIDNLSSVYFRYKQKVASSGETSAFLTKRMMCLEDMLDLSHNITAHVPMKRVQDFIEKCQTAAYICSNLNQTRVLPTLFDLNYRYQPTSDTIRNTSLFTVNMERTPTTLLKNVTNGHTTQNKLERVRLLWYTEVQDFLVQVLKRIFCLEITLEQHQPEPIRTVDTNTLTTTTYKCISTVDVLDSRKGVHKRFSEDQKLFANNLHEEIAVSKYILHRAKLNQFHHQFHLSFITKIKPISVDIYIQYTEFALNNLISVLTNKFQHWLNHYFELKEAGKLHLTDIKRYK